MRRTLLVTLLLVLAAATAGCFGGDDNPDDGDGGEPTTTTPPEPTPTTPTEDEGNETTEPPPPPSITLCTATHNFAQAPSDPATVGEPVTSDCGELAEGYTSIFMNVTWSLAAPAYVGQPTQVSLLDPAGSPIATCNGPAAGDQEVGECLVEVTSAPVGLWQLQFSGEGGVSAQVNVDAA